MTDFSSLTPAQPSHDATAVMGRRILAWAVDLVIFLGIGIATFAALAEYTEVPASFDGDPCTVLTDTAAADPGIDDIGSCFYVNDRAYTASEADGALQSGVSFAYLIVFIVLQGVAGGSPGKLVTGLRVVNDRGERAGVGRSLVRTLLWIVDGAPWFAPLVGFIVGLTTTGHRRVGDLVAKTYVISRKDMGAPVSTGASAPPPPGQSAWGAPPTAPPSTAPPPMGAGPSWQPAAPPAGPSTPAPAPQPSPSSPSPSRPHVVDGGVVGPPPLPAPDGFDEPRPWDAPIGASTPEPDATRPTDEADSPTDEAATRADEAPPTLGADPAWYRGPEADPSGGPAADPGDAGDGSHDGSGDGSGAATYDSRAAEPDIAAPDTSAPETWSPTDPATEWSPPTTPTSEIETGDNASPTAGPGGFVAPGSEPPASPAAEPTPAAQPSAAAAPPPQWDQARNTYIQWDPAQQQWLQWDTVANRWKLINT